MPKEYPTCAQCTACKCFYPSREVETPDNCAMKKYPDLIKEVSRKNWSDPELKRINLATEKTLYDAYDTYTGLPLWHRLKEVMEFAKNLGVKKLGIAMCTGLVEEGRLLNNILVKNGFEVVSVNCMVQGQLRGETEKEVGLNVAKEIGLEEWGPFFESIPFCSPVLQAEILNREKTELNLMLGLCVGHDILFIKHSKAYVSPLVVKDRVLGHNPVQAIYASLADTRPPNRYTFSYYTSRQFPPQTKEGEVKQIESQVRSNKDQIEKLERRLSEIKKN